jgi:glycosyltransferase involved in cell wall biosynthesis
MSSAAVWPGCPKVSVIIPTRDRPAFLRQALASVRALEGPDVQLEIIVADNGSGSEAVALAHDFGALYRRVEPNGISAARNAALRSATGDYVAFLDDDDCWLPSHLRPHVQFLADHPEFDAVVGQIVNTDFQLSQPGPAWPVALPSGGDVFDAFLEYLPQLGATVVRSSVLDSVGYFDESLMADEDWDWHLRLAQRHRVGFVPVPCLLFRQRPAGVGDDMQRSRMPFTRQVLRANLRRADRSNYSWWRVVRLHLRHAGSWSNHFMNSAAAHAQRGDWAATRRALLWSAQASPLHTVWAVARQARLRNVLLGAIGNA